MRIVDSPANEGKGIGPVTMQRNDPTPAKEWLSLPGSEKFPNRTSYPLSGLLRPLVHVYPIYTRIHIYTHTSSAHTPLAFPANPGKCGFD